MHKEGFLQMQRPPPGRRVPLSLLIQAYQSDHPTSRDLLRTHHVPGILLTLWDERKTQLRLPVVSSLARGDRNRNPRAQNGRCCPGQRGKMIWAQHRTFSVGERLLS